MTQEGHKSDLEMRKEGRFPDLTKSDFLVISVNTDLTWVLQETDAEQEFGNNWEAVQAVLESGKMK